MILVTGTFRLPPHRLSDARSAMASMVEASRAEPGCREYAYAEDVLEPGLIRVHELWVDQDALDRHFASDHMVAWRAAWHDLGITDRMLVAYSVGDPRPT